MSTATIAMQGAGRISRPLTSPGSASRRLEECSRLLRKHVQSLDPQAGVENPAVTWLIENHSFVQFQIRETRRALPASYLRLLPKIGEGAAAELRVYRLAADFLAQSDDMVDAAAVARLAQVLKEDRSLLLGELWAFGSALKLVLIERLCANLESELVVSLTIGSLRALELVGWRDFTESVSVVERVLERDPAGVYARMDFATRDHYRHQVETMARRAKLSQEALAQKATELAQASSGGRAAHVGYYLIGPGTAQLWRLIGCKPGWSFAPLWSAGRICSIFQALRYWWL